MANTSLNRDGLIIEPQDLSALSPGSENHGRLYNHDGSSSITLTGGESVTDNGFYMWDANAGGWNPLKLTVADADYLDGYDSSEFAVLAEGETVSGAWNFTTAPTISGNAVYHAGNKPGVADLAFDPATQTELDSHTGASNPHSGSASSTDLSNHAGDANAHHTRYSDAEARTAVDGSSVSITGDAGSVDGYDIQKNGTDGAGIINFKT